MSLSSIIFYLLSSGAIISSIMVITARNPIHSVLFLVLVFFNVAGLLILVWLLLGWLVNFNLNQLKII